MAEKVDDENFLSLEDENNIPKASKSKIKIPKLVKKQASAAELELEQILRLNT